ncbi:MAG: hypothetical protein JST12_17910 [Armatimonadetes bacterium]|nr:hypothetical protein [Armatimonadota bacterium]
MFGVVQRRFKTHREWDEVWHTPVDVPAFVRDLGEPGSLEVQSMFHGAVHFLAGYLQRFDFRLFRNGGLPLIERRTGAVIEEVLVRLGPNSVRGAYLPISMNIHVCHEGLRPIRERYWPTAGRPPVSLVSGNIGLVQNPPTHDIWNVATEDALAEITTSFRNDLLPYLELLASPNQLRRAVFDGEAPMFDHATAVEWLLMEFGRSDAREYIRQLMDAEDIAIRDFWHKHDKLANQTQIGYMPGDLTHNLAVIAFSHDICKRWLY